MSSQSAINVNDIARVVGDDFASREHKQGARNFCVKEIVRAASIARELPNGSKHWSSGLKLVDRWGNAYEQDDCILYQTEVQYLRSRVIESNRIMHKIIVGNQSAWLAAQSDGAEAGMIWIRNGLDGPGHVPEKLEDANEFFKRESLDARPTCECTKPASYLNSDGQGFCGPDGCIAEGVFAI